MNILLANMPVKFNRCENLEPPLGITYLAAVLQGAGEKVYLQDYELEEFSPSLVSRLITERAIDVVGVSFRTASYLSAKEFTRAVKKKHNPPVVVAGGHHATAFPEYTLQDLGCDVVVRGEAEGTFLELVGALKEDRPLEKIRGLSFWQGGRMVSSEKADSISDIDRLPFPARHLLPMERYSAVTILTSRGCPFSCIYCDKGISTRQVKYRSPESVYAEIRSVASLYPRKRIYFVDDHFFLAQERLKKIFDCIIRDRLRISWVCQARADGVDSEILKMAKSAGCEMIMFGVESGDPGELAYIRKQCNVEDARRAIVLTKQAQIKARANFMLGFPISTHKSVRNTIEFAKSVPLDIVRFFSVTPLPNTELWDRIYGARADLGSLAWDKLDFYTATYRTAELTQEQIRSYVGAAYLYLLTKRAIRELTAGLMHRFIKLFYLCCQNKRIRGNLSLAFPAAVNLLLDMRAVMHAMKPAQKLRFMLQSLSLARSLAKGR